MGQTTANTNHSKEANTNSKNRTEQVVNKPTLTPQASRPALSSSRANIKPQTLDDFSQFNNSPAIILKITGKVMGVQRAAAQFIRLMSNNLRWGVHELPVVKPNCINYRKRLVGGPPPLMVGILRGALEVTGAKSVKVDYKVLSVEEDDILYEVVWQ